MKKRIFVIDENPKDPCSCIIYDYSLKFMDVGVETSWKHLINRMIEQCSNELGKKKCISNFIFPMEKQN